MADRVLLSNMKRTHRSGQGATHALRGSSPSPRKVRRPRERLAVAVIAALLSGPGAAAAEPLAWVALSEDGSRFVRGESKQPFRPWGVNYDHHDKTGALIEDYWHDQWEVVVEDFGEIAELGANTVRIHLQLPKFMKSADEPDAANLARLKKLLALADDHGLYLDLTGLGCYHKQDVPEWYDALPEGERWAVQARFWEAVAQTCAGSPAVFCYDLMNEPILPGKTPESEWLAGELGGKHFVQRISLDLEGRSRQEVARAWIDRLTAAIRKHDRRHLVTVGVIPWALTWPNAEPFFYSKEVGENLDFVSVHFYPEKGEIEKALAALKKYDLGKPLVVEECFPLRCSAEELEHFMAEASKDTADGWISFYWGKTADEYEADPEGGIAGALKAGWLRRFAQLSGRYAEPSPRAAPRAR